MAEALTRPGGEMAEFIQRALEDLPPKIAADVIGRGIVLTGGGALLDRLDAGAAHSASAWRSWCRRAHALRHQGHARRCWSRWTERQHLLIGP